MTAGSIGKAVGLRMVQARAGVHSVRSRFCTESTGAMHQNPTIKKFYKQQPSKDFPKQTTGFAGVPVEEHPHRVLSVLYTRTLRSLNEMPETASYRKYTESIVKSRLHFVQNEPDINKLEEKIGMGQIEEVIDQAQKELECCRVLLEHKVWEPLVEKAPEGQWNWPV